MRHVPVGYYRNIPHVIYILNSIEWRSLVFFHISQMLSEIFWSFHKDQMVITTWKVTWSQKLIITVTPTWLERGTWMIEEPLLQAEQDPCPLRVLLTGKARLQKQRSETPGREATRPGSAPRPMFCSALLETAAQMNAHVLRDMAPKCALFWREVECDKMESDALCNWPREHKQVAAPTQTGGRCQRVGNLNNCPWRDGASEEGDVFSVSTDT